MRYSRFKRNWALLGFLLILPLGSGGCGDDGEAGPQRAAVPTTADLLAPGPYAVGTFDAVFTDPSRPTMANRNFPGAPERRLPTTVWYPAEATNQRPPMVARSGGPFPLVVYAHGFLGNRAGGTYLARHLASHGYVVAGADFPLTSFNAPGGATFADLANQPGDVSFLISAVLSGDGEPNGGIGLARRIHADAIGVMGLSLGGATSLLVTFHPQLHDPRIAATVAHAPPACFLTQTFFATRSVPLLIVHGDIDAIVPYQANAVRAFERAQPPKYLVTLLQGNHTSFTDGAERLFADMSNADDLGCSALLSALANSGNNDLTAGLGGTEAGIQLGGCPLPCTAGPRNPPSMRPQRQHDLALAATLAHFEAWLRRREGFRLYLENALAAENGDARVEWRSR